MIDAHKMHYSSLYSKKTFNKIQYIPALCIVPVFVVCMCDGVTPLQDNNDFPRDFTH